MSDLIRLLLDILRSAAPFRLVWQWERGLYYLAGRCVGEVGPGLKLVVPYLCDVKRVTVVPSIYTTPLQTITLQDGRTLTYSASATVRVVDVRLAYNSLEHWQETVVELVAGLLSDGLATAPGSRLDPSERAALIEELRADLDAKCRHHGLAIDALRLNNFCLNIRTLRLLTDRATFGAPPVAPDIGSLSP